MAKPFPVPLILPFSLSRSFAEKIRIGEWLQPLLQAEHFETLCAFLPGGEKSEESIAALRDRIRNYTLTGNIGYAFVVYPGALERSLIVFAPPWRLNLSEQKINSHLVTKLGYTVACLFGKRHLRYNFCIEPLYDNRVFPEIPKDPLPHVLLPELMVIHDVDAGHAGLWRLDQGAILLNGMKPW